MRPDGLRAVEAAGQVDAQVALPQVRVLIRELADVVERARVVDQDVDRAELLDDAIDGFLHLLAVRDVALDRRGAAAHLLDLLRGRLGVDDALSLRDLGEDAVGLGGFRRLVRLDLDVRDHDVRAGAGERQRVGAAESPGASRDQGYAPGEVDFKRHASILR